MIWESSPWKVDIARRAESLEKRTRQRLWPEAALSAVERDVFVAAYEVRKLLDAKKVSDEVEGTTVPGRAHLRAVPVRPIDFMNWYKVDVLYDLSQSTQHDLGLRDFCNQIIHSFVFVALAGTPAGLRGFFVASDRDKEERLLYFDIAVVVRLLRLVADDDIVRSEWVRENDGQIRFIVNSSRHEPIRARAE